MTTIRSVLDGRRERLTGHLLIGRSPACGLRIDDSAVSNEHASLTWTATGWSVRDLGSKNGTFVDGARLRPGSSAVLRQESTVAFGRVELAWTLESEEPPSAFAVRVGDHATVVAKDSLLALPDEGAPLASVYEDSAGDWKMESETGELHLVEDGEVLEIGAHKYRLFLPYVPEGTPLHRATMTLGSVTLELTVSRDEERVDVVLLDRGIEKRLRPREHGYVLLTLARLREQDRGLAVGERGWRERAELERMLKMDANALNVSIHRARKQLLAAGVQGAAGIVEVKGTKRRLGIDRFRILRSEDA